MHVNCTDFDNSIWPNLGLMPSANLSIGSNVLVMKYYGASDVCEFCTKWLFKEVNCNANDKEYFIIGV